MALSTQPISLSGFSYSCDSTKGLSKRTPKSDAMSWGEFDRCMRDGMTYEQVNAIKPMTRREYDNRVKAGRYQQEHVRKHAQKIKAICEMYDNGVSIEEIAKANNITLNYCKQILSDNERSYDVIGLLLREKDKIQNLADRGYTKKAIAKEFNVTAGTITKVMRKLDIKTLQERLKDLAEDYTRSTFLADLKKYGSMSGMSKATGIKYGMLQRCARTLNIIV